MAEEMQNNKSSRLLENILESGLPPKSDLEGESKKADDGDFEEEKSATTLKDLGKLPEEEALKNIPEAQAEFLRAGAHFGHQKSRVHPSMFPFIFGVRNGVHIIDVEKTVEKVAEATNFLRTIAAAGKQVLFVGTKLPVRDLVRKAAEESGMPYMIERWPGGVLTNWKTFTQTLEHLMELEAKKKSEEWEKYTKYERLMMDREINKLELQWGGMKALKRLPDAVVIADVNHDNTAFREAKKLKIPVVAVVNTNTNITRVDYLIPASDNSVPAVRLILEKITEAIKDGKAQSISVQK